MRSEQEVFDREMREHIGYPAKNCDDPKCIYCLTYGQILADQMAGDIGETETTNV